MTTTETVSPGERVTVGCFVDRTLKSALLERARENERTLSGELRVAITQHLNQTEGTHAMDPDPDSDPTIVVAVPEVPGVLVTPVPSPVVEVDPGVASQPTDE